MKMTLGHASFQWLSTSYAFLAGFFQNFGVFDWPEANFEKFLGPKMTKIWTKIATRDLKTPKLGGPQPIFKQNTCLKVFSLGSEEHFPLFFIEKLGRVPILWPFFGEIPKYLTIFSGFHPFLPIFAWKNPFFGARPVKKPQNFPKIRPKKYMNRIVVGKLVFQRSF